MSGNIISLETLLEQITKHEVLAVSTPTDLAKAGQICLTIWATDPSVDEELRDVDEVRVGTDDDNQTICDLDYVYEVYGLDFLGHTPLYLKEDVQYPTLDGDVIYGQTIREGISQLDEIWNKQQKSYVRSDDFDGLDELRLLSEQWNESLSK